MQVRAGREREAAELTALAMEAKASWGHPAAWIEHWRADLTISPDYVRRHTVRVAVRGGRPAGFGALEYGPDGVELAHLWVRPAAQRHGVGILVEALAGDAAGRGHERLSVTSDPNAVPFYERLGGVRVG